MTYKKRALTLEVAPKWIEKGYTIRRVLRILGLSPSTYYYQKKEEKAISKDRPVPGYSYNQQGMKIPDEQWS